MLTDDDHDEQRRGEDGHPEEHVVEVVPHQSHLIGALVAPHYARWDHEAQGDAELQVEIIQTFVKIDSQMEILLSQCHAAEMALQKKESAYRLVSRDIGTESR